jgi:hypothetical protein
MYILNIMETSKEFNEKWGEYLKEGYYGLSIDNPEVIEYLDEEFTKEILTNPSFEYIQIKMKFGTCRVYSNTTKSTIWEEKINDLVEGTDLTKI